MGDAATVFCAQAVVAGRMLGAIAACCPLEAAAADGMSSLNIDC